MAIDSVNGKNYGVIPQGPTLRDPSDYGGGFRTPPGRTVEDRIKHRQMVKEELRYLALVSKEENGTITEAEKRELAAMKLIRAFENFVINTKPTVMYCA